MSICRYISTIIVQHFMQHMIIKFSLCHIVVIGDDNQFKSVFNNMYDCLTINYEVVAKYIHKGVSWKKFHHFLNKVVTVASNDRDTVSIFQKPESIPCMNGISFLSTALTSYVIFQQSDGN